MYIYQTGAVGKAVRAKIEETKQSIHGGKEEAASFGELLKTYMIPQERTSEKTAAPVSKSVEKTAPDGSALLYALQNSGTDSTAASVLNLLGYTVSAASENRLRTAAEDLVSSVKNLDTASKSGSEESLLLARTEFAADYNELLACLGASGTTSGYLYRNVLDVYSSESTLSGTGFEAGENGTISAADGAFDKEKLSAFLSDVSKAAQNISVYAASSGGTDSSSGIGSYYGALSGLLRQ